MIGAERLLTAFPMAGLVSFDFLVDGNEWWLIEINPRPGATLDIFDIEGKDLFHRHVEAASGSLQDTSFEYSQSAAASVVYADRGAIDIGHSSALPGWIGDRPRKGTVIAAGEPAYTVRATTAIAHNARKLCEERVNLAQNILYKNH